MRAFSLPAPAHWPAPVRLWSLLLAGYAAAACAAIPAALESPLRVAAALLACLSLGAAWTGRRLTARVASLVWTRGVEIVCGSAALLAAGGCLCAEADRASWPLPVHPRRVAVELEGRVIDSVPADASSATLTLEARSVRVGGESAPCRSTLVLRWGRGAPTPAWASPGLWIGVRGAYRPPEDARNPGVAAPGRWLERIHLAGTVDVDPATVTLAADPPEAGVPWSGLLRHRLAKLFSRDLSPPVAALARGMALGDRSGIAPSVRDAFRDGGTIHILSISGLHVCVLAGIVAVIAVALRLPSVPALLIELLSLWSYVLLVGAPASAARSAILWTAMRAGRLRGSAVRPFAAWGLAGLLLLLGDPCVLGDPGFQLSFAAVLGLAASGGLRAPRGDSAREHGFASRARDAALGFASLAKQSAFAEAGTLGIQVLHFGAVPVAGLFLNLAVIPLCGAFMAAMLLHLGCVFLVPALEPAAAGAVEVPGLLMLWLTARVASAMPPVAARAVPSPAALAAGLLALLLAAAVWEQSRVVRGAVARRAAGWTALGALLIAWALPFAPHERRARRSSAWILALDVGQGDATIARVPGATLLIDAGPSTESRDEGRYAVEPAIRAEGITRVDAALLSHAHSDHYGGLAWVSTRGFIRAMYENGSDPGGAWREPIRRGLARSGGAAAAIRSDTTLALGTGVSLRVLGAERALPGSASSNTQENNRSLVAALGVGGGSICFAGDVERDAEIALLPRMARADVVKVPHHGSKTSSDAAWIDAVHPRIALVSCGERNRFGHPDPSTIGRYLLRGVRVFRTDLEGAIRVTLTRDGAFVSTRAHPSPELLRWNRGESVSRSGQSP